MAPLVTAVTVYVTRELAYEPSVLGLILTAYGVGTVAGAITSGRLSGGRARTRDARRQPRHGPRTGLGRPGTTTGRASRAAVVAGTTQSMVLVTYLTLRTAESPDALLGRIGSTARTISLGLQPIGLLVGGALVDATSASLTITVMAIGVAGVSLLFLPAASFRRARLATR